MGFVASTNTESIKIVLGGNDEFYQKQAINSCILIISKIANRENSTAKAVSTHTAERKSKARRNASCTPHTNPRQARSAILPSDIMSRVGMPDCGTVLGSDTANRYRCGRIVEEGTVSPLAAAHWVVRTFSHVSPGLRAQHSVDILALGIPLMWDGDGEAPRIRRNDTLSNNSHAGHERYEEEHGKMGMISFSRVLCFRKR
jgi:hypothetical protein